MKALKRTAALLLACVTLAGCASNAQGGGSDLAESPDSRGADNGGNETEPVQQADMPVIDIKTKNTDSLDFVTEPVARHVAEAITTWDDKYVIPAEPYYEECTVTVTDADKTVLLDSADAEVKVRGNWTTTYNKKPLRIKFAEKHNMLGLNDGGEYKNWLLLAEYKDFSMLRNKTALQIARELLGKDGYYAADAKFVEVTINGEYWGVYLLSEQQQVGKGRVEISSPEKDYQGTDIGYFFEYDNYYVSEEPLNKFHIDYHNDGMLKPYDGMNGAGRLAHPFSDGKNDPGYTIKSDIYCEEQRAFIEGFVGNVYNIMYEAAMNDKAFVMNEDYTAISETTDITPREAVERVVDVQSLADAYIMAELTCDADLYYTSFFMDADFGEGGSKKLRFEAPWDFDSALGNKERCPDGSGYYASNLIPDVNMWYDDMCNPWTMVPAYMDWYRDIVAERWTALYDSGAITRACDTIQEESAKYEAVFKRNYDKWDNIRHNDAANEFSPAAAKCGSQKEAADYLSSWLQSRAEFLNKEWHKT